MPYIFLFSRDDLYSIFQSNLKEATTSINNIPENQYLNSSDEEIIDHVYSKREFTPLEIHEDRKEMATKEIQLDIRNDSTRAIFDRSRPFMTEGIQITVSIPFSGEALLWQCRPSSYFSLFPRAWVHPNPDGYGGNIELMIERATDSLSDGNVIKQDIQKNIGLIHNYLELIKKDVEDHNNELHNHIKNGVLNRRMRLGKTADIIKFLDIPLKKNNSAPDLSSLPMKRKLVKPLSNQPKTIAEYCISDEHYDHILKVIRHEGHSFESTPATFLKHDEPELRDIILAHLNGHYEGDATGETFRSSGKTDIRIEFENRAAFIGECKVWRGPQELLEAFDQLLGYLTWKDCKTALIVFNKDISRFSELQTMFPKAIEKHPHYNEAIKGFPTSEWRYRFRSKDDPGRRVMVHVFLFNLYLSKPPKPKKGVKE